jgi:hypothetical protein
VQDVVSKAPTQFRSEIEKPLGLWLAAIVLLLVSGFIVAVKPI